MMRLSTISMTVIGSASQAEARGRTASAIPELRSGSIVSE
jgi:hypothetical protein